MSRDYVSEIIGCLSFFWREVASDNERKERSNGDTIVGNAKHTYISLNTFPLIFSLLRSSFPCLFNSLDVKTVCVCVWGVQKKMWRPTEMTERRLVAIVGSSRATKGSRKHRNNMLVKNVRHNRGHTYTKSHTHTLQDKPQTHTIEAMNSHSLSLSLSRRRSRRLSMDTLAYTGSI